MKNTPTSQDLVHQIEQLVQAHLAAVRAEAEAAVIRAFASATQPIAKQGKQSRSGAATKRRTREQIEVLGQRLLALVVEDPGATMTTLAPQLGLSALALQRPMSHLKESGQVRSVGRRHQTQYFPLAASDAGGH